MTTMNRGSGSAPEKTALGTREVARMLGVGEASVKRWADAGLLACYRTPGAHRKFRPVDVELFMRERGFLVGAQPRADLSPVAVLRLARAADLAGLESLARDALDAGRSLAALCDELLVPALVEIGDQWACHAATVAEEHIVSSSIVSLVARLRRQAEVVAPNGSVAVLGCAPGEQHDIATRMLALVLRERGYTPMDTGANTPVVDLVQMARAPQVSMVLLSASQIGAGVRTAAETVNTVCQQLANTGIRVMVGGSAYEALNLPEGVTFLRDLRSLASVLDRMAAQERSAA